MLTFTDDYELAAPVEEAWHIISDINALIPCLPGAELDEIDGSDFTGQVKVKVGPIQIRYRGRGRILERDEATRVMTIEANGSESAGTGTASAQVTARLEPISPNTSRMTVAAEFEVTGTPARFGSGAMNQVAERILDRFAASLVTAINRETAAEPNGRPSAAATPPEEDRELSALDLVPASWRRRGTYAACFGAGLCLALALGRTRRPSKGGQP